LKWQRCVESILNSSTAGVAVLRLRACAVGTAQGVRQGVLDRSSKKPKPEETSRLLARGCNATDGHGWWMDPCSLIAADARRRYSPEPAG
jgi:hypothetical protein